MAVLTPLELILEYEDGHSLSEISTQFEWPISRVRTALLKAGLKLRTPQEAIILAAPKISERLKGMRRGPWSAERRTRFSRLKTGKGKGVTLKADGYVEITIGVNKGRTLHDIIMESIIGRPLASDEVVHHKDENR